MIQIFSPKHQKISIRMSLTAEFLGHMVASFNLPTTRPSTYGGLRAMRLSSSMSKFPRNQIFFKIKKSIQILFLFLGFQLFYQKFLTKIDVCTYMQSKIHCQSNFSIFWRKNPLKFMFVFCYLLPFQCTQ